jgi:asparagine synthase (glutamine-hydrolysing)
MCGIVGIINKKNIEVDSSLLESMTDAIAHRGPTGRGTHFFKNIGIGNRRLAIIDIEGGKQPLCNEDNSIWITYNGELYNYRSIRHELESLGHQFLTNSDTETIVHSYEEWGSDCVEKFRGMFAFAILDEKQETLFLARDHFGIKPLYYLHTENYFAFSSEIQAFWKLPGLKLPLDIEALDQYLCLQYIPAPKTAFRNMFKLPPASKMQIDLNGMIQNIDRYWDFEFKQDNNLSENDWIEGLEDTLQESIKAHLISDVPFGAFLSGGIDSSAIVTYMAQELGGESVRTFSIGFQEEEFNELNYAKTVADKLGTNHTFEVIRPAAFDILPDLVKSYGEPFGDSSAIPTYYVSQLASSQVPMVLSGDGSDEFFAGYQSYLFWMRKLTRNGGPSWRNKVRPIAELIYPQRYPKTIPGVEGWLNIISYLNYEERNRLWLSEFNPSIKKSPNIFIEGFSKVNSFSLCNQVQYLDINTYLPFDILTKVDIASMMHSLEVRTPFIDIRVLEFASKIPQSLNIDINSSGEWEGKLLLKNLLKKYFSSSFLHRPKKGFAIPISSWISEKGEWRKIILEKLTGDNSQLSKFFNTDEIFRLVRQNRSGPIWLLVFLNEWLIQNKDHIAE